MVRINATKWDHFYRFGAFGFIAFNLKTKTKSTKILPLNFMSASIASNLTNGLTDSDSAKDS